MQCMWFEKHGLEKNFPKINSLLKAQMHQNFRLNFIWYDQTFTVPCWLAQIRWKAMLVMWSLGRH